MALRLLLVASLALAAACRDAASGPPKPPAQAGAVPASAVDVAGEAAASYRVHAAFAPPSVARGASASLSIAIEPARPDVHVQQEFPLKIGLTAGPGLELAKTALGHADARDPSAKGRLWEVAATGRAGGSQEVVANLRFAVCKETEPSWCVTRTETIRAALEVR